MTNTGHKLAGLAVGAMAATALLHCNPDGAWFAVFGGYFGGTLPDRLEWVGKSRWCDHRTITHWWPIWIGLGIWSIWNAGQIWASFFVGMSVGAISHILLDWPNPTGIPLRHPWKRHSLQWWRSGQHEVLILLVLFSLAGGVMLVATRA